MDKIKGEFKRRLIVLGSSSEYAFREGTIAVPCGQCIGCRLERSKQWATRIMHEAQMHVSNRFITLTYDDDHIPYPGTLVKEHMTKFWKNLRYDMVPKNPYDQKTQEEEYKKFAWDNGIRYFQCGEYGDQTERPHYHAIVFNCFFPDEVLWTVRDDIRLYTSNYLDNLWGKGMCTIGDVTFESAAYVARYITKKINGEMAEEHYMRTCPYTGEILWLEPEYATMSLKPGIGKPWYDKYKAEVFPVDEVIMRGKSLKPPRYYDSIYEFEDAMAAFEMKQERIKNVDKDELTPERLRIKKAIKEAQLKFLKPTL